MKMHELLSEAPAAGSMAISTPQLGPTSPVNGGNTHAPSTAANLWRGRTGNNNPPTPGKSGSWSRWLRMQKRQAGPKFKDFLTRGDLKQLGAGRAARAAGMYLSLLKWLNFYDFAVEYWTNVTILEAMVKTGELEKSEYGPAKRMMAEELAVNIALSTAFPNLIKWFFRLRYLKWIPQILGGLATVFTGGGMAAAEIAIILATEAASIALQNYLKTPAGQECVSYIVVAVIDPGFKWLYDQGPGRMFGKLKELKPETVDKVNAKVNPNAPIGPALAGLVDKVNPSSSDVIGGPDTVTPGSIDDDDAVDTKDKKPSGQGGKPSDAKDKDKDKEKAADKKKPADKDSDSDMFDPTKAILGFDPGKIKINPLK
jgi:hypothetical protein